MNRRRFLLGSAGLIATGGILLPVLANQYQADLPTLLSRLRDLQGKTLASSGSWSVSEVFQHLTQSVQGAYLGYPQLRASWFRHTVGPLALTVFKASGQMHHPLDEAIPGMPALDAGMDSAMALQGLIDALQQFAQAASLQPHFAYGALSAADFACAHRLHIEAHLQQISVLA